MAIKIEGRLLEPPNQRAKNRTPPRGFSTLIKTMVIELDRDPAFKVVSQLQYCPDREDIMYVPSLCPFSPAISVAPKPFAPYP
ncbi:hypothetical protein DFH94DRAFT_17359 [Russula ochroleuca]|uniref:Uncharacterized protein n=1 Tax=Russula ochroleuca TaxID=152965 RepID=A0A9P5N5X9_9AGAM|nr:hypothetical protein DFH94DRAFT_17359 [Russula ochroleuca]